MQGEQWGSAPGKGGGSCVIFRLEACPATLTSFLPPSTSWTPFPAHTDVAMIFLVNIKSSLVSPGQHSLMLWAVKG